MPFGMHPWYLIILLAIILIIFGPGKLPELGGAIGRGIREFQKSSSQITEEVKNAVAERESTAATATPTTATPTTATPTTTESPTAEPEKKS